MSQSAAMWLTWAVSTIAEIPDRHVNDATYGLAELAHASGVPERTIRYYQAEKLLPRPAKRGRDAVYDDGHLERLRLIGDLRDRGLKLQTIRDLVATDNPTRTVSQWLGVDATLSAPWSDDRPRLIGHDELVQLVERHGDRPSGLLGELVDAGYISAGADSTWDVPSPTLLDLALRLRNAGIDLEISGRMRDLLRRRLAKAVDDTVKLLIDRAGAGFAGGGSPDELATALGALRPVARETTSLILAQEVERALGQLVESRPRRSRR